LTHLLIANRGEIALRVLRSARELGYRVSAIYSEADAGAPHVRLADQAVCVGPAPAAASYLNIERIVQAARQLGADAVHPGYGLLSENADFAQACLDAGLTFVGPRPHTIRLMADKRAARRAVQAHGVPCVPGYDADDQSDAVLAREAERIGVPLMVKAAAGGGGRGMRRVEDLSALPEALARARSESLQAFGDDRLILERALERVRHVEVQVFADAHGHVIHLGERDCSLQRRFQKVVEEAPSPAVDGALRERLGELAVRAARSADYLGAGTVELLLTRSGECYFLEMNTRLQVEHPVTELITGFDLVEWQLRIAQGEALPCTQADVRWRGHAIEARLYAEVPERGFLPATGRVLRLALPPPERVRFDHWLETGLTIGTHYDALLGKLIAHGPDREAARRALCAALDQLRVLGLETNQRFLRSVLEHPAFVAGAITTDFVDRDLPAPELEPPGLEALAACAVALLARDRSAQTFARELRAFTNCGGLHAPLVLEWDGRRITASLAIERGTGRHSLHVDERRADLVIEATGPEQSAFVLNGVRHSVEHAFDGAQVFLYVLGRAWTFTDVTYAPPRPALGAGSGRAIAPMDGAVVSVPVQAGEHVVRGQTLAVVEAMKLELRVAADADGEVVAVHVRPGAQVKARQLLIEVRANAVADHTRSGS
jgi:geranyl-CoA carboxylase alpha subunit